ncbi:hypothetical protein ACHHYP_08016 [Achlya hypogyna]|uniref:EF-hand domain-containing protein n=1 Tax=Achlya hypogyna TaxID=1202772 RepID=A0A1V9YQ11_ACHHY|nr:hypothetical protein ACHHYP_08016 [Achlya hypogyna]
MGCLQSKIQADASGAPPQNSNLVETYADEDATSSFKRLSIVKPVDSWIMNSNEYVAKSKIDKRIIQILQERKKKMEANGTFHKSTNFERVALQFGNVEIAFMSIREMYDRHCNTKAMTLENFCGALTAFGASADANAVRDIFNEADVIRDNSLNFNEFAISLAICYLLDIIPNLFHARGGAPPDEGDNDGAGDYKEIERDDAVKISKAFETVVNAYLMFDRDASGIIKWGEMKEILNKPESTKLKSTSPHAKFFNVERWKELDWNKDGSINFQEFFLAFQKWVGIDEDDG